MKNVNFTKTKLLFSNPEFIGRVLRQTNLLEFYLDCILVQYVSKPDRRVFTLESVVPELPFSRKITILSKLPLRKSVLSRNLAVKGLERFRRLRNLVAHSWILEKRQITSLFSDQEIKAIITNYPKALDSDFQKTRRMIQNLVRVLEFQSPDKTRININSIMSDALFR